MHKKQHRALCLLEEYLATRKIPQGEWSKLNSTLLEAESRANYYKEISPRSTTVTYTPDNLSIQFTTKLYYLDSISETDPVLWAERFHQTLLQVKWTEEQAIGIIQALVNPCYLKELGAIPRRIDCILNGIRRLGISNKDSFHITTKLNKTKQWQFASIKEYYLEIKRLNQLLSLARDFDDLQESTQLETFFLANLGTYTAMFLEEKDCLNVKEGLEELTRLEQSIVSRMRNRISNDRENKERETRPRNNVIYKTSKDDKCSVHPRGKHTNKDCRAQRQSTAPNEYHSHNVRVSQIDTDSSLTGKIEKKELNILLDSGSTRNLINKDLLCFMDKREKGSRHTLVMANGQQETSLGLGTISFEFISIPGITYHCEGLITSLGQFDLILGVEFLREHGVLLDFENKKINIDRQELEMREYREGKIAPNRAMTTDDKSLDETYKEANPHNVAERSIFTARVTPHSIITTSEMPINLKQFPVALNYRKGVVTELQRLVREGIIIPGNHKTWSSPAFPIPKKNGDIRLVVAYNTLNSITIPDTHPSPSIEDLLLKISNACVFSAIDLKNGYHQVVLDPQTRHKTGFSILNKQYEFLRLPFGLKNAPKVFQRMLEQILDGCESYTCIYLDDILIFSESHSKHLEHLKEVKSRLKQGKLEINEEKSKYAQEKIKFLGRIISKEGIAPDPAVIQKLQTLRAPRTKKQIQRVLGILNWYRPFLRNLSENIVPITDLLLQKKVVWTAQHQQIIDGIISSLNQLPYTCFPDTNQPYQLYTDASDKGIGAVLRQNQKLIGFYSKKLNQTERNYTVLEKEVFAMVKGLMHFKTIILGSKIELYTDCRNAIYDSTDHTKRINRWLSLTQEFDVTFTHIPGSSNAAADALSRAFSTRTQPLKFTSGHKNRLELENKSKKFWANIKNVFSR